MKSNTGLKASLVVPVFNNEKTAVAQLRKCEKIMKKISPQFEIVVSEDKSTDSTATLIKNYFLNNSSFKLFFNKKNLGIAKNVRKLYRQAKYPYIILFSVDGDWDPTDIERLLVFAKKHNADIVIGKRKYLDYSLYRKIVSFSYNFLSYLLFQVITYDAGSIKVFRKELFEQTQLISESIFFEAEFIVRTAKKGGKVRSIPVSFNKLEKRNGTGGNFKNVLASLRDLVILRLRI